MKNLRNAILIGLTILSFNSTAQISIGAGGGLLKSTDDNAESLLGGELVAKYDLSDAFRVGVNLGYYQTSDEFFGTKIVSRLVPVSVSGEYLFLEDKFRPYVGVHAGLLNVGAKVGNTKNSESYFNIAPVVGVEFSITDNIGLNANFKYGFAFYKDDFTGDLENYSTISPNIGVFYKL